MDTLTVVVARLIGAVLIALALAAPAQARTVHLYGDSIFKGWGFGHYDDPSPLGRVDRIASLLARANGSNLRFNRTTVQAPSRICMAVASGQIRPTDTIVFEDAGPRFQSAAAEQAWLEHVVKCAIRKRGRGPMIAKPSRLVLSTMFDYQPSYPLSTYDDPLEDGRSVNDITRQVARTHRTSLLDWNTLMDRATAALPELRLTHSDGIHPTAFGNIVIAASLVRHERVSVSNFEPLVAELMAVRARIVGRFAPNFTALQARAWLRLLLKT